uniref:Lipocalin/cytosolic fatty-acid binding domain-containing protein n=1 Tax=Catagonus wagneri TaxID=51154 RepID=A0A8C3WMN3_9CETA
MGQRRAGNHSAGPAIKGQVAGRAHTEVMALLLLSLGLSLVSAQDLNPRTIVRRDYDMARVSGSWYSISMASDDMKRIEEGGDLRVFMESIESLEDGGLKFNFHFMLHGECVEVAMVCDKTDRNGEYTVAYLGENRLLVSETDYRLFVTIHLQNIRNGTRTQVLALYGTASICGDEGGPRGPASEDRPGPVGSHHALRARGQRGPAPPRPVPRGR